MICLPLSLLQRKWNESSEMWTLITRARSTIMNSWPPQSPGLGSLVVCYHSCSSVLFCFVLLVSLPCRQAITEENVKIAFEKISNHNDVITPADLKNLLGVDASWKSVNAASGALLSVCDNWCWLQVEEMMEEVGLPRDAPITFIRFKKLMMDTGNLVNQQRMKRRLTFISSELCFALN